MHPTEFNIRNTPSHRSLSNPLMPLADKSTCALAGVHILRGQDTEITRIMRARFGDDVRNRNQTPGTGIVKIDEKKKAIDKNK